MLHWQLMRFHTLFCSLMDSKNCSCSSMIQWIPIPTAILVGVCCFSGSGFQSIFLTSIALISSTALFVYSTKTGKESILRSNEYETSSLQSKEDEEEDHSIDQSSGDSLCGSECINPSSTREDSEVEWPFTENGEGQSLDFSDEGSISDEESLIEIVIPTGHYVGYRHMQKKIADFSPDSIFQRSNLMDDEDNLIEIDISMGLIKCSRF